MDKKPNYVIAIFSQDECGPCIDLKEDVRNMHHKIQREIEFFPMKTIRGQRTAWCEELGVEFTPTLIVTEEDDCDKVLKTVVGRMDILKELQNILLLYTDLDLEYIDSIKVNDEESKRS